ncbi:hypothetical protein J6590_065406 [Homalodisca vitripennis]|nr:hypothetical protein J6590_016703 [Homalodisca vitripennis]KAG8330371.1 hypothetical protein J6590_065406 [Homalodisca vitripennis]
MTHAALPRSEAFHLRLEVQARARNERQRGTIGLRVRQRSLSYLMLYIVTKHLDDQFEKNEYEEENENNGNVDEKHETTVTWERRQMKRSEML